MMIEDVDLTEENRGINQYFARQIKPKDFMGEYSAEVKFEKAFETNCILLSEYANKPVKELTTKEYFTLLAFRNEKLRHGRQSNKTQ